jgi:hypothetical protein
MTLPVDEFLRRFLLHLLPRGFVRIRHFGFLANRRRASLLPICFELLRRSTEQAAPAQACSASPPSSNWRYPTVRRNHAHRRTNLRCPTVAPFSAPDSQVRSMNRFSPSRSSRVRQHEQGSAVSFGWQRSHAVVAAVHPALHAPTSINPQRSMPLTRVKKSGVASTAASIGAFKLHKRPPPQRLPSSRCI